MTVQLSTYTVDVLQTINILPSCARNVVRRCGGTIESCRPSRSPMMVKGLLLALSINTFVCGMSREGKSTLRCWVTLEILHLLRSVLVIAIFWRRVHTIARFDSGHYLSRKGTLSSTIPTFTSNTQALSEVLLGHRMGSTWLQARVAGL